MAAKILETVISVVDKTAAPFVLFQKRVNSAIGPVNKLNKSLSRLGRVSGFNNFVSGLAGVKNNSLEAFRNIRNIGQSFGYIGDVGKTLFNVMNKVASFGDDVAKTSRRLGVSVESLQKFRYAADLAGVPVETMQESVRKMAVGSVRAAMGVEKEARAFNAMQMSVRKSNGELKNNEELLIELSDKFKNAGLSASEKLYAANEIFGKSGSKMIELLNQGPEKIRAQFKEIEKYGIMNKKQAEASEEYADALTKLNRAVNGFKISFGSKLVPVMTKSVNEITENIEKNKDKWMESLKPVMDAIPDLVDSFVKAVPGIMEFFGILMKATAKFVDFFGVKWPMIAVAASGVVAPLAMTMVSISKILWFPIKTFLSFGPKIVSISKLAVPHLSKLKFAFKGLGIAVKGAFGPVGLAITAFEIWLPTLKLIYDNLDMIKSVTFDDLIFCVKELNKSFDGLRETISNIPIIGAVARGLGSLAANKVDFSGIGDDPIADAMLEAVDPGSNVGKSSLFQSSVTRTINNNTKSTIDVNFHNVPNDVTVSRKGYGFGGSEFGFNMVPAF